MKFQSLFVGAVFLAGCASQQPQDRTSLRVSATMTVTYMSANVRRPLLALATSSSSLITA